MTMPTEKWEVETERTSSVTIMRVEEEGGANKGMKEEQEKWSAFKECDVCQDDVAFGQRNVYTISLCIPNQYDVP